MTETVPPTGPRGLTAAELADVEAIFMEVSDIDTVRRLPLLDVRCAGRPRIRAEIDTLLQSHDRLGAFLESPLATPANHEVHEPSDDRLEIGVRIGPYRLIELIGRGGMGDVYLAERADGLFDHRVAIKVMRSSLFDRDAARRFSAERQILASLQHPQIVTLLDGGVTPAGDAYLVMEHVAGVPITSFVRAHQCDLAARLRLIRQVCEAVRHAHQHGIVHRDLKPANILVTADGRAKVLDFGVAKLLEASRTEDGTLTRGALPGPLTPNYASPEQLRGLPVTTASDVYALGVLTFEIVTGARPYDTTGKTLDEMLVLVLETGTPRPSATRPHAESDRADAPLNRDTDRRIKGDLDAIVLKAMSKEPERRYGSAGELADDLERFLEGKPVVAREPSWGYVLGRLAARNRIVVGVAAASLIAIVAALGLALWQRQIAVRAQTRAEQRFKDIRQLSNALIFKIHDAVTALPGSTPVRRTIVDEALAYLQRLEADSAGDESLQVELAGAYRQIGAILGDPSRPNLGDREGARREYERARRVLLPLATRPSPLPAAQAALVGVDGLLSSICGRAGDDDCAEKLAREAVRHAELLSAAAVPYPEAPVLLGRANFSLALALRGEAAITQWRRVLELYEAQLRQKPEDSNRLRNVALAEKYLGGKLDAADRDDEAAPHYRRALELDEKRYAADPANRQTQFDLAIDLANVAVSLEVEKKLDEAYAMYVRSLELRRALSESDPTDVLSRGRMGYAYMKLARLDLMGHRPAGAIEHARKAVLTHEQVLAKTQDAQSRMDLGEAVFILGQARAAAGDTAAACAAYQRAMTAFDASRGKATSTDEYYAAQAAKEAAACDRRAAAR